MHDSDSLPASPEPPASALDESRAPGVATAHPRRSRWFYFGVGFLITALSGAVSIQWLEFGAWLLGQESLAYDRQPEWFRLLGEVVAASPFIAGAFVLIARFRRGKSVRLFSFALGAILPVAALITWIIFVPIAVEYANRTDFDSATWKQQSVRRDDEPIRLRMVDDLLDQYELQGMTSQEVYELLGPGERTSMWDSTFVYWLGPERGFLSIDSEWLLVDIGEEGRVHEYGVLRD